MLVKSLIALGAYALALAVVAAWIFYDFGATRRRAMTSPGSAERLARLFLLRLSILVGLISGTGVAVLLSTLMSPAPNSGILVAVGVGDALSTAVALQIVIRNWPRMTGRDPLAEIRGASALPTGSMGGPDGELPV